MRSDLPGSNATRIALGEGRELAITVVAGMIRLREFYQTGRSRTLQPGFGAVQIPVEVGAAVGVAITRIAKSSLSGPLGGAAPAAPGSGPVTAA